MSNAMFNNKPFSPGTIWCMHQTVERLYAVAKAMKGIAGQSAVASLLNESPQTVNNWEARGISTQGALKAQKTIGCDANWVLSGEGSVLAGWPFSPVLFERVKTLLAADLVYMERAMWTHLREEEPASVADAVRQKLHELSAGVNNVSTSRKIERSK